REASVPWPEGDLIDWEEALESVAGDREMLRQLVLVFLDEAAELMRELSDGVERRDLEAIGQSAHTPKGAVLCLASPKIVEVLLGIELSARGGDLAEIQANFPRLQNQISHLRAILDTFLRENESR